MGTLNDSNRSFFQKLPQLIRWNEWSDAKLPFFFIIFLYLQIVYHAFGSLTHFYTVFFFAFLWEISYYSFLFLTNDYFDLEQDVHSGKKKILEMINKKYVKMALIGIVIFAIIALSQSWLAPSPIALLTALATLFGAFYYSAPPLRWKEKGIWGILVGSFTLRPAPLLALLAGLNLGPAFLDTAIIMIWIIFLSIRRMTTHQLEDLHRDRQGHVKTFATEQGARVTKALVQRMLSPLEVLTFCFVLGLLVIRVQYLIPFVLLYFVVHLILRVVRPQQSIAYFGQGEKPFLFDVIFLFLPVFLSLSLLSVPNGWIMPLIVLFWQRRILLNFVRLLRG